MQQRKRRRCPSRAASTLVRRRYDCAPRVDDRPKRLVRLFYEDVLMGRRVDLLEQLLAPEFVGYDSAGAMMDRDGYLGSIRSLHDGFGQLSVTIEDQLAERDRVTTRWSAVATHTGVFAGIPPTGREVVMAGTDIHRVDGYRLAELWEQVDFASLLAQLL